MLELCLLVAAQRLEDRGSQVFNFEVWQSAILSPLHDPSPCNICCTTAGGFMVLAVGTVLLIMPLLLLLNLLLFIDAAGPVHECTSDADGSPVEQADSLAGIQGLAGSGASRLHS